MKVVSNREFEALKKAGLLYIRKSEDRKHIEKNFRITSKRKKAPRGKCYVDETHDIMEFLKNFNE